MDLGPDLVQLWPMSEGADNGEQAGGSAIGAVCYLPRRNQAHGRPASTENDEALSRLDSVYKLGESSLCFSHVHHLSH
jgi:hypothetical protein